MHPLIEHAQTPYKRKPPCGICEDGWEQYLINTDTVRCSKCGYEVASPYMDGPSMPWGWRDKKGG